MCKISHECDKSEKSRMKKVVVSRAEQAAKEELIP